MTLSTAFAIADVIFLFFSSVELRVDDEEASTDFFLKLPFVGVGRLAEEFALVSAGGAGCLATGGSGFLLITDVAALLEVETDGLLSLVLVLEVAGGTGVGAEIEAAGLGAGAAAVVFCGDGLFDESALTLTFRGEGLAISAFGAVTYFNIQPKLNNIKRGG